jgi:hypothetical protein
VPPNRPGRSEAEMWQFLYDNPLVIIGICAVVGTLAFHFERFVYFMRRR